MKKLMICCIISLLYVVAGCGNPKVTGKVALPDGTPVGKGEVIMQNDKIVAKGKIQEDGTFAMGTKNANDGIPRGEYKVYLLATEEYKFPGPGGKLYSAKELKEVLKGKQIASPNPVPVPAIHKKFESAATSGLTCSVSGRTVYNIDVLPPE